MATTTIGRNDGTNDWGWDGTMKVTYINQNFNISGLGRMVNTNCFFARVNSGGSGGARAWRNGSIILDTTTDGVTLGNTGAGTSAAADASCSWHTSSGDIATSSGENWLFGANCSSGLYHPFTDGSPDTFDQTHGVAAFVRLGHIHAYGTYFIVETYVRRSNAWVKLFPYVRRSSTWSAPGIYIRRSGSWTQVRHLVRTNSLDWKRELEAKIVWPDGQWEPALARWDYDRPRYIGVGYPGWKRDWKQNENGMLVPMPDRMAA